MHVPGKAAVTALGLWSRTLLGIWAPYTRACVCSCHQSHPQKTSQCGSCGETQWQKQERLIREAKINTVFSGPWRPSGSTPQICTLQPAVGKCAGGGGTGRLWLSALPLLVLLRGWRGTLCAVSIEKHKLARDLWTSFPHHRTGRYFCPVLEMKPHHKVTEVKQGDQDGLKPRSKTAPGKPSLTSQLRRRRRREVLLFIEDQASELTSQEPAVFSFFPPSSSSSSSHLRLLFFSPLALFLSLSSHSCQAPSLLPSSLTPPVLSLFQPSPLFLYSPPFLIILY